MTVRMAELLMGVLTLILSIIVMVKSTELAIGWVPGRGPGGGFWPFWLAGIMALASCATILRWFLRATPESRSGQPFIDPDTLVLVFLTVLSLLGVILITEYLGMYFAVMLFLIFYLKVIGRHGWPTTLAFAFGGPVFIFCLFEWALQKDIPKGSLVPEELYYPLYDLMYG